MKNQGEKNKERMQIQKQNKKHTQFKTWDLYVDSQYCLFDNPIYIFKKL